MKYDLLAYWKHVATQQMLMLMGQNIIWFTALRWGKQDKRHGTSKCRSYKTSRT